MSDLKPYEVSRYGHRTTLLLSDEDAEQLRKLGQLDEPEPAEGDEPEPAEGGEPEPQPEKPTGKARRAPNK